MYDQNSGKFISGLSKTTSETKPLDIDVTQARLTQVHSYRVCNL